MSEESTVIGGLTTATQQSLKPISPSFSNALPHYLPLLIFPLLILALLWGDWWLLPPFLFMSVAGPLDRVMGQDGRYMNPAETPLKKLFWHNLPVWAWALAWPPTLIFGMWQILAANPHPWWQDLILVILLTMEAQAVFVVGHELIHRRSTWERRLAEFLLASSTYPQYAIEHIYIHHANVGTPIDVGSAPKGESFWQYFPKEVKSNLVNSWRATRDRQGRRGNSMWHFSNPFWRFGIAIAFWYGLLIWMGGVWTVPVYVFLSLGCVFSMKLSNYFQHYGLRRVRLPNGRWEKVMPRHSWGADWKFSNWMFFNMQRHADHHAVASRHYPLLQISQPNESPELPGTYSDMMNIVLRPKKWFERMDPLVDAWRAHFYPEIDDWTAYDSPIATAKPESFEALIEIFGVSPRIGAWIKQSPELLNNLQSREFTDLDLPTGFGPDPASELTARQGLTRLYWTYEMDIRQLKEQIAELPTADSKETVEIVRNWSNDKAFQIAMHVLRGNLTPTESTIAISNLAEAAIDATFGSVVNDFIDRVGVMDTDGFVAVALGDLASKNLHFGSSFRLWFVFNDHTSWDSKRLTSRLAQRVAELTRGSLIFAPLPKGETNCEGTTLSNLVEESHKPHAQEPPSLTRARMIFDCDNSGIRQQFEDTRKQVLSNLAKEEALLSSLTSKPSQVEFPLLSDFLEVPGGLNHIERVSRYLQLTNTEDQYLNPSPSAAEVLEVHPSTSAIKQSNDLCRGLQATLNVLTEMNVDLDQLSDKVKKHIATLSGFETIESLTEHMRNITQTAAVEIDAMISQSN